MDIFLSKAEDGFDMRKEILKLSGPIIAQSMIVYLVMAVENLLIGRILPSAFAAMTLTTQIYNITSLVIQGIIGGGNILFAKHFGSRDYARMRCIIRYEFIFTAVFIGGVSAACLAAPRLVMSILTDHEDLIHLGGIYIRIMGMAWLLASCSMVVTQVLRTIGEAGFPMKVAAAEMASELIATVAILSSGLSPEGKLQGIALSFLGLKLLELGILSACLVRRTAEWTRPAEKVPGFFGTFFQTVLPVTANELLWALGTSLLVTFIGRQDQTVIAAYGICVTAESLAGVLMSGLDLSSSMVLGKSIAQGREKIVEIRGVLRRLALEAGALEIAVQLGMLVLAPRIYDQGEAVDQLAACLLAIDAGVELFKAAQCMSMTGILRPLGDVRFCFLNDILFQWLYIIPGTWLLLNVVQVPFAVVFFFMKTDQIIKVFTSERRINSILKSNDGFAV